MSNRSITKPDSITRADSPRRTQGVEFVRWLCGCTDEALLTTGLDDLCRRYPELPREKMSTAHAQEILFRGVM